MNDIVYVGKHALTHHVSKHLHNDYELIYCTGGKGELVFANKTLVYGEDSVAVIPPMIAHKNFGQDGFTNIHCVMRDTSFSLTEPVLITGIKNGHLRNAFEGLFYYFSADSLSSNVLIPIYAQLITTMIEPMIGGEKTYTDIVKQIIDAILKSYPDPNFDLNQFLMSFSFSTEYLKRIFRQEMAMTPRQFLSETRLENAAKILGMGAAGVNISEVARQCGYNDPLYFSKVFKRKYGVSPKNYVSDTEVPADSESTKIYQ